MNPAERLRAYRKHAGLTIEQAAKLVGVSAKTLSLYERGIHRIPLSVYLELAKLYDIDVIDLKGVNAPHEFEEDIPAYNIILAHCYYTVSQRIKTDKLFGNERPNEYYDREYKELIESYVNDEFYREQFEGLETAQLPDKYFK